jgi:hypothetical protein
MCQQLEIINEHLGRHFFFEAHILALPTRIQSACQINFDLDHLVQNSAASYIS